MKPILFNTDMVRTILDGRKTVTRRVVKPLPEKSAYSPYNVGDYAIFRIGEDACSTLYKPPYHPGDILYVRETWNTNPLHDFGNEPNVYVYKADYDGHAGEFGWHPSIHMPREATRIFLRVTDVLVEKLQGVNERGKFSAAAEGFTNDINLYDGTGKSATKYFSELWNSTIKPADRARYGWDANPWVWVIAFERISKKEAYKSND